MDLEIENVAQSAATVLTVAGDIDIQTAPQLSARLAEVTASGGVVVVDLSAVEFLDSSGLGVLVGAARDLGAAGGSLRLACPRPHVQKIFRISRLADVIPIFDDLDAAVDPSR